MARASAVKMPPEANAAHGCEGARRVLALMLTFSADDHTLTARQLAERTGIALPSATCPGGPARPSSWSG